jgi:predicted RNA polymerase sigma factor
VNEPLLRDLVPAVIGVLVRRGADFASAEDAVQDALVEAVRVWPDDPPQDPKGWLVTVAWRKFLDAARADTSRRRREVRIEGEPMPGPVEAVDDTLQLYFLCAHPSLTPASSVALTLRAVGGLTTRQIAQAYLVPEAQAAIAALHADAHTVEETDWVQIVEWYDELLRLTDNPVARLNRAVAVGEADGPRAGLAALAVTLMAAMAPHSSGTTTSRCSCSAAIARRGHRRRPDQTCGPVEGEDGL